MFRRALSAGLACALGLSVAPLLAGSSASAAQGDVLTAHWWSGDKAGGRAGNATVTPGQAGGTTTFRWSSTPYGPSIRVQPPTGAIFEPGRSYEAAATRTAELAALQQSGYSTCTSTQWTGTIDVKTATYDEAGVLTSLAASYVARCTTPGGRTDVVAGDLRFADQTPYAALLPTYTSRAVAVGHERATTATLTASGGSSISLGSASVAGTDSADYRVTANGCAGATLTDGESCDVTLAFAPREKSMSTGQRLARLVVDTPGSLAGSVSVPLNADAVVVPDAPRVLTTFPVADGVGLTWQPSMNGAETYHVERRWSPDQNWTVLGDVATGDSSRLTYLDRDVARGQHVEYRVTGDNSGWPGQAVTTSTTRPGSVPTAGSDSTLAAGATDASKTAQVYRSTETGTTVRAFGGDNPQIQGARDTGPDETFYAPPVPGPGVYRLSSGQAGSLSGGMSELNCAPYAESVLRVRQVLFGDDLTPVVYDASWTALCKSGTVARAEIRLGVDRDVALTTANPSAAGLLTTFAGTPVTQTVTLGNRGPVPVDVGTPQVAGDAAADWSVTGDSCAGKTLGAGETCTLDVRFATSAAGTRNARLEVPLSDSAGPLAPHLVLLQGRAAVVPTKPTWLYARGMLAGIQVYWTKPSDDGGYPIDRYDVQRRSLGSSDPWALVGRPTEPNLYDPDASEDGSFEYRVRAVNKVGPGPWSSTDGSLATEGVVVEGGTGKDKPRTLYLVSGVDGWAPAVPMTGDATHDRRDPAVSPGGTKLVYSRSAAAGLGEDGEYDLWLSSVDAAFGRTSIAPTRLTDLSGAELDAAVSPDASKVAFTHVDADGRSSVWVVPAAGGAPFALATDAAHPAWMPSGTSLLVADTTGGALEEIPLAGGDRTRLAETDGAAQPAVSRDGKVAFIDRDGNLRELPSRDASPVVRRPWTSTHSNSDPAYTASGHLLVTDHHSTGNGLFDVTANKGLSGGLRDVGPSAPGIRDVYNPSVSIDEISDTYVRGVQEVAFSYRDGVGLDETPYVALRVDCRLDAGAWSACSSPATLRDLSDGRHTFRVRVRDEAGHQNVASTSFVSDRSAPSVAITSPRGIADLDGGVAFTWKGSDPHSPVYTYDVAWRRAGAKGGFGPWRSRSGVTDTKLGLRLAYGDEACLRVRARNRTGYVSPWRTRCVGRPSDDASLSTDRAWRLITTRAGWMRSLTEATSPRARVWTKPVTGRRIAVLAQTCPGCGSVRVYAGSRFVGKVSLASPRTRSRVWLRLPLLQRPVTARVRLVTTSRARVRIDGVLVRRT